MNNIIDQVSTKVVGVMSDAKTEEGIPIRQLYIKKMKEKDIRSLKLMREPENPYDSNAIAIYGDWGLGLYKIGYVQNRNRICIKCSKEYNKVDAGVELCPNCGGILARDGLATTISSWIDRGAEYKCRILQYTGGEEKNMGINIMIEKVG